MSAEAGLRWYETVRGRLAATMVVLVLMLGSVLLVGSKDRGPGNRMEDLSERERTTPAPSFAYRRIADNAAGALADHTDGVILVNLWATWCIPCLEEMPTLERLQREYGPEGLLVITASREPVDVLSRFADRLPSSTLNVRVSPVELPQPFRRGFQVLPTTFILDRERHIRHYFTGARSYQELAADVEALVGP